MQKSYYYTSVERAFSVQEFARVLGLDFERVHGFCEYHGLGMNPDGSIMVGRMPRQDEEGRKRHVSYG
jgi:hypothetical protein